MILGRRLKRLGVLGINQRNADFILPKNPRHFFPMVDNKRITKNLALEQNIQTPPLYGVIEILHDLKYFDEIIHSNAAFVLKPAQGSGGNGIVVVKERVKNKFRKSSGALIERGHLEHHIANILSGMFSLGGVSDACMVEYCVEAESTVADLSYQGVADIRTIVYKGIPVMAMMRLPTQESDGKANLHQGAAGVGIDLASGVTTFAILKNKPVLEHPDLGVPMAGFTIPRWHEILEISARCYEITGLGYLGVDVVIDQQLGPLLLELNARPGLSIQLANDQGMMPRLKKIDSLKEIPEDYRQRVELSKTLF